MPGRVTERAFETYAEEIRLTGGGWRPGSNAAWEEERALFPPEVFAFIEETQPRLWAGMRALHASGLKALLLATLVKELDAKGSLHVLRHGFKFCGKTFRLACFKPARVSPLRRRFGRPAALDEPVAADVGRLSRAEWTHVRCHTRLVIPGPGRAPLGHRRRC